ncbi:MAG: TonB family protein, partial [Woeseiaceae bacterium]
EKAAADKAAAEKAAAELAAAAAAAQATIAKQVPTSTPASERQAGASQETMVAAAAQRVESQTGQAAGPVDSGANEPERVAISRLKRTKYVPPKYPRSAQRRNTSGWVDVSFTVARDGSVHSIEIIESTPGETFDEAATQAVSQWRFEPIIENGVPVEKRAAVRMMFSVQ